MLDGTIEIITGRSRRRRWSVDEKLRIVGETHEPGSRIGAVAVRHDISASLLHSWRYQVRHGLLAGDGAARFVPVRMLGAAARPFLTASGPAPVAPIDVVLTDGSRLSIRDGASAATLRAVIAALRG